MVTEVVGSWATGTGKLSDVVKNWANSLAKDLAGGMAKNLLFGQQGLFSGSHGQGTGWGSLLSGVGTMFGLGGTGTTAAAGAAASATGATATTGGSLWGSLISGVASIAGYRASGGPVMGGRAYVVGEHGPELMVPHQSGNVIPNRALQAGAFGGGGDMTPIVINQTIQPGVSRVELMSALDELESRTTAGVLSAYEQGGSYRRRMRS